jgi:hypothetical protein
MVEKSGAFSDERAAFVYTGVVAGRGSLDGESMKKTAPTFVGTVFHST